MALNSEAGRVKNLQVLELDANATYAEVKTAYKRLALKYHPDKSADDPKATAKFQELSKAYCFLKDLYEAPPKHYNCYCPSHGFFYDSEEFSDDDTDFVDDDDVSYEDEFEMDYFQQIFMDVFAEFVFQRRFSSKKKKKKHKYTEEEEAEDEFFDYINKKYKDRRRYSDEFELTEEDLKKFHSYDEWKKDRDPRKRCNRRMRRAKKRDKEKLPKSQKPTSKKQQLQQQKKREQECQKIGEILSKNLKNDGQVNAKPPAGPVIRPKFEVDTEIAKLLQEQDERNKEEERRKEILDKMEKLQKTTEKRIKRKEKKKRKQQAKLDILQTEKTNAKDQDVDSCSNIFLNSLQQKKMTPNKGKAKTTHSALEKTKLKSYKSPEQLIENRFKEKSIKSSLLHHHFSGEKKPEIPVSKKTQSPSPDPSPNTSNTPESSALLQRHLAMYENLMKVQPQRHTEQQIHAERVKQREENQRKQQKELEKLRKKHMGGYSGSSETKATSTQGFGDQGSLEQQRQHHLQRIREMERKRNEEEMDTFKGKRMNALKTGEPKWYEKDLQKSKKPTTQTVRFGETVPASKPVMNVWAQRQQELHQKEQELAELIPNSSREEEEMLRKALLLSAMEEEMNRSKHIAAEAQKTARDDAARKTKTANPNTSHQPFATSLRNFSAQQSCTSIWDIEDEQKWQPSDTAKHRQLPTSGTRTTAEKVNNSYKSNSHLTDSGKELDQSSGFSWANLSKKNRERQDQVNTSNKLSPFGSEVHQPSVKTVLKQPVQTDPCKWSQSGSSGQCRQENSDDNASQQTRGPQAPAKISSNADNQSLSLSSYGASWDDECDEKEIHKPEIIQESFKKGHTTCNTAVQPQPPLSQEPVFKFTTDPTKLERKILSPLENNTKIIAVDTKDNQKSGWIPSKHEPHKDRKYSSLTSKSDTTVAEKDKKDKQSNKASFTGTQGKGDTARFTPQRSSGRKSPQDGDGFRKMMETKLVNKGQNGGKANSRNPGTFGSMNNNQMNSAFEKDTCNGDQYNNNNNSASSFSAVNVIPWSESWDDELDDVPVVSMSTRPCPPTLSEPNKVFVSENYKSTMADANCNQNNSNVVKHSQNGGISATNKPLVLDLKNKGLESGNSNLSRFNKHFQTAASEISKSEINVSKLKMTEKVVVTSDSGITNSLSRSLPSGQSSLLGPKPSASCASIPQTSSSNSIPVYSIVPESQNTASKPSGSVQSDVPQNLNSVQDGVKDTPSSGGLPEGLPPHLVQAYLQYLSQTATDKVNLGLSAVNPGLMPNFGIPFLSTPILTPMMPFGVNPFLQIPNPLMSYALQQQQQFLQTGHPVQQQQISEDHEPSQAAPEISHIPHRPVRSNKTSPDFKGSSDTSSVTSADTNGESEREDPVPLRMPKTGSAFLSQVRRHGFMEQQKSTVHLQPSGPTENTLTNPANISLSHPQMTRIKRLPVLEQESHQQRTVTPTPEMQKLLKVDNGPPHLINLNDQAHLLSQCAVQSVNLSAHTLQKSSTESLQAPGRHPDDLGEDISVLNTIKRPQQPNIAQDFQIPLMTSASAVNRQSPCTSSQASRLGTNPSVQHQNKTAVPDWRNWILSKGKVSFAHEENHGWNERLLNLKDKTVIQPESTDSSVLSTTSSSHSQTTPAPTLNERFSRTATVCEEVQKTQGGGGITDRKLGSQFQLPPTREMKREQNRAVLEMINKLRKED